MRTMLLFICLCFFTLGIAQHCAHAAELERDYGRTCLALAMFSEARSEGVAGMYEVGLVALRRTRDPKQRWGTNLCDVIQSPEQFIGVSHWAFPRQPEKIDKESWDAALELADKIIANGIGYGPCIGAVYFNQSRAPGYICRLGALYFYGDKP